MSLALLFPGQGSQSVGMGGALAAAFPVARDVFGAVDEALGQNLFQLMQEGPEAELTLTENAQPALMAVSLAVVRVLSEEFGVKVTRAAYAAGHSLGEYSALAATDALSIVETAKLLKLRGQAMQLAAPVGSGAMASLVGPKVDVALAEMAAEAGCAAGVCAVANDNNLGNVVISGDKAAVDLAIAKAKELGARAIPLNVAAPFHCPPLHPDHRQCHRPPDQRSGRDPPPFGPAGHRPRALARVHQLAGGGGRRHPLCRAWRGQGAGRHGQAHGSRGRDGLPQHPRRPRGLRQVLLRASEAQG